MTMRSNACSRRANARRSSPHSSATRLIANSARWRGAPRPRRAAAGPRVYVLPGLMGSRLGTRGVLLDDVLWVDLVEIAAGHLTRLALPRGAKLVALGAILLNALKLKLSLQIAGFDARLHAYDWRRSIGALAADLNDRIATEAARREVLLVGHSMGGVVARVAYGRQSSARVARVVQLGAPNHGAFAPVLALRGVYPTVRKLAALDRRHSAEDLARIVFRTLPVPARIAARPATRRRRQLVRSRAVAARLVATGRGVAARRGQGTSGLACRGRQRAAHRGRAAGHHHFARIARARIHVRRRRAR